MIIPKFTVPQAKLIRTLEGWLVVAFNLAMVIVPIVSSALPAATAVKYAAIVNTATVIARQLAKGVFAWQAPLMPAGEPITAQLGGLEPGVSAQDLEQRLSQERSSTEQAIPAAVDRALAARLARLSSDTAPAPSPAFRPAADTTAARQAAAASPAVSTSADVQAQTVTGA